MLCPASVKEVFVARKKRPAPLPIRDGLNPVRLQMPHGLEESTVLGYLQNRFSYDAPNLARKMAAGEIVDELGRPYGTESPYRAGSLIFLYRDPVPEKRVPYEIEIIFEDDDLLVIDKPHFLATTPKGAYIVESALVRLRRQFNMDELSPAHRLDRLTAGVLVFTKRAELRRAYHEMFAHRTVLKTYQAVAGVRGDLQLPTEVATRIHKERGVMQAQTVPGEPNTLTRVELAATRVVDPKTHGGQEVIGLYDLFPHTGKTHQLRLHMAGLGVGILNDNYYPTFYQVDMDDYANPLQLLAKSIEFEDPITFQVRKFESTRGLELWH